MSDSSCNNDESPINYYKEATKLYYYNCILYNQLEKILNERNDLKCKLLKVELLGGELAQLDDEEIMNQLEDRKKKSRRNASEIDRQFFCQVPNCKKAYGTEASLTQHVRLKHNTNNGIIIRVSEQVSLMDSLKSEIIFLLFQNMLKKTIPSPTRIDSQESDYIDSLMIYETTETPSKSYINQQCHLRNKELESLRNSPSRNYNTQPLFFRRSSIMEQSSSYLTKPTYIRPTKPLQFRKHESFDKIVKPIELIRKAPIKKPQQLQIQQLIQSIGRRY